MTPTAVSVMASWMPLSPLSASPSAACRLADEAALAWSERFSPPLRVSVRVTTIEAQEFSARLARKSIAYNGVVDRFTVLEGDLRDAAVLDRACADGLFDLVTGSPPYWPVGAALAAAHPQAVPARLEVRGDVSDYARAAVRALAPGGAFVCVHQASQHARVLAALQGAGLSVIRTQAAQFKAGVPAEESGLRLYIAHKSDDVPHTLRAGPVDEPPLVIRDARGQTPAAYAALRISFGFPPGNVPPGDPA